MSTTPDSTSTWAVRMAAGEPLAVIRVRHLQSTVPVLGLGMRQESVQDAWGRSERAQPLLISAEVALNAPFPEASASDQVADDTVHYGTLSKALLKGVETWISRASESRESSESSEGSSARGSLAFTLRGLLDALWMDLTGFPVGELSAAETEPRETKPAVLDLSRVRLLSLALHLPKASLLGEGVSLTATGLGLGAGEARQEQRSRSAKTAVALRLHGLRVPTLIGVHPHERRAKQTVVADVTLDPFDGWSDEYVDIEATVVKILETSAYETLEALATHIARTILLQYKDERRPAWQVKVVLDKPMAVPFAESPVIEVRLSSDTVN